MSDIVATYAPASLGHVRFRRDGDRLCVDEATSVMWFAFYMLEGSRANTDIGLSFDGSLVTLRASNGLWIWQLTGRSRWYRWNSGGEPFAMVEGIWPD